MAADVLERGRVDPVRAGEAIEMVTQPRAFRHPPSHSEVRVIALRKHPAVSSGDDPELDPRGAVVRLALELAPRDVPLERHAADDAATEPGRLCDDAVRPVRADEEGRPDRAATHAGGDALVVELDPLNGAPVAEVGAGGSRLLGEMVVEAPTLGHVDERCIAAPR